MKTVFTAIALGMVHASLWAQGTPATPPSQESIAPQPAAPESSVRSVKFLLGIGITGGGDTLATATYTDGSTQSITAGGLVFLKLGADWQINPNFSAQGTLGFHRDATYAKNGDLTFERNFVEGLGFWHFLPKHRIGLGLRQTSGAKLSSSGAAASVGNYEFNSGLGKVLEYEWMISRTGRVGFGLTFRLVNEKYSVKSINGAPASGPDINGSHAGIGFNVYF
jgi:hypothetical protein